MAATRNDSGPVPEVGPGHRLAGGAVERTHVITFAPVVGGPFQVHYECFDASDGSDVDCRKFRADGEVVRFFLELLEETEKLA